MNNIYLDKVLKIKERLTTETSFFHVIIGPRQVGKTTAAQQISESSSLKTTFLSADGVLLKSASWLKIAWDQAVNEKSELLIIDEIQKVENWSEQIKELWDQRKTSMRLLLLGSSSLAIHKGLSESLAGRFRLHQFYHWDFIETNKLNKMDLKTFFKFGGYPGSYSLTSDRVDWLDYLKNSIIEPVIGKDILSLAYVKSPALFRQSFDIICSYAAQEISYSKLLGQLQDKGNTDFVKHYIELFEAAFLIKALQKYSGKTLKKRSSSPKILPLCPALYSVTRDADYTEEDYGHAFEIVVGAYLNSLPGELTYWRERNYEVDFIYSFGRDLYAIEVKYGKNKRSIGLEKFVERYPQAKTYIVTPDNLFDFFEDLKAS